MSVNVKAILWSSPNSLSLIQLERFISFHLWCLSRQEITIKSSVSSWVRLPAWTFLLVYSDRVALGTSVSGPFRWMVGEQLSAALTVMTSFDQHANLNDVTHFTCFTSTGYFCSFLLLNITTSDTLFVQWGSIIIKACGPFKQTPTARLWGGNTRKINSCISRTRGYGQ